MKDVQSELFTVVNEQDEIIEYRSRYDCHHNPNLIHRSIDVLLKTSDEKYIFQKRSKSKDLFPGYYCVTATGHVDKGETYEQAAYRELKEEMNILDIPLQKINTFIVRDEKETEMICLFIGVYDGKISFPRDEVESIHHVSKNEIAKLLPLTPCSHESLKLLHLL